MLIIHKITTQVDIWILFHLLLTVISVIIFLYSYKNFIFTKRNKVICFLWVINSFPRKGVRMIFNNMLDN